MNDDDKKKKGNIDLGSLKPALSKTVRIMRPYVGVFFFLVSSLAYGFVILRINSLSSAQVDDSTVQEKVNATPSPHVDSAVIKQLESLKDNSVNVQTLFQDNRINPFKE